ncbi:MAG: glucose-6-phosphate isomerase [Armatimonadetes bacterium]|nr:glucose-6-phosphate isomerase [Armatimonadota bacterium]
MTERAALAVEVPTWEEFQQSLLYEPETGISADFSRAGLDGAFMVRMRPAATEALAAMEALEKGAIANPDENRMVGHYWLRAPELAPQPELRQAIESTRVRIRDFAADVHSGKIHPPEEARFERVLSIGIGGSALGPQFVSDALGTAHDPMQVAFFDNTDPDGMDRVLSHLGDGLARTLVLTISKSGGTPETYNGMREARAAFSARGLDFTSRAVAITGAGSKLDELASREGWLARFPMWDWVGGRTSVMSAVGLVPAALQGIDVEGFLAGAAAIDRLTRSSAWRQNPALMLALAWHRITGGQGKKDMVILPYKDRLALFSRYLQQLVMESLGKEQNLKGEVVHQGIAVYGNKGSTDQHAYVQQLRDGVDNFFVTFIVVLEDRQSSSLEVQPGVTSGDYLSGFWQGTRQALTERGRASITLTVPRVSPATVGGLIALYERAVGYYASLVGVNAYHQPGVEAGKQAAQAVLDLQQRVVKALGSEPKDPWALAMELGEPERAETIFHICRHLAANGQGAAQEGEGVGASFRRS